MAELFSDKNESSLIFVKFKGEDKASISQRSDYGNQCILFAYEQLKNRLVSENICVTDTTVRPRKIHICLILIASMKLLLMQ